uniref:Uncharacterized protein n=1 Tax=Helianthus annuus TaxID=4232 RepID=A0A251TPL0_HELAN
MGYTKGLNWPLCLSSVCFLEPWSPPSSILLQISSTTINNLLLLHLLTKQIYTACLVTVETCCVEEDESQ